MKQKTKNRVFSIIGLLSLIAIGMAFILIAFNDNLMYFQTPSEVVSDPNKTQDRRVGGMVVENSIRKSNEDLRVQFDITDYETVLAIQYEGILPDLFREGQGVVVIGKLKDDVFVADAVLAKHDENYMPQEIQAMVDRQRQKQP